MKNKGQKKKVRWNRLFYNTKFAVCFSVLLSIVLWAALVSNDTQDRPRAITDVPVKITLSDTAQKDGMKVFTQTATTVTAYVKGNSMVVNQLKSSDLEATAPFAATITSPGNYTVPLTIQNSNQNLSMNQYTVSSISPEQVIISVDRNREKTFSIQSDISYKKGYKSDPAYFVGTPALSSDTVTISGPEKQVTQVNRVAYEYEIGDTMTDTQKFTASLVLYDANGNKLDKGNMMVSPEKVDVTIPVMPRQTCTLEPTFTNKPVGLSLGAGQVHVTPVSVEIAGPKDTLTAMAGKASLDPIDFSTISPTHNTFDANITLPTTCKNLSNLPTVKVTLNLDGMTTRTMSASSFNVKNLASDKGATVNTTGLSVTVVGSESDLSKLADSNIVGSIDLSAKENFTGQTEVPVTFSINNSSTCWVYGSYMVTVTVTQKAS